MTKNSIAAKTLAFGGAQSPAADHGMSTDRILNKSLDVFKENFKATDSGAHLDIGVGTGTLTRLVRNFAPNFKSYGVDYTTDWNQDKDLELKVTDLNQSDIPHADNTFDFVSCVEVLEHLENFRSIVREGFRVLKPGGVIVFTTPNVLSLKSRIRYFLIGFPTLFGPIRIARDLIFATNGHITPVSYFFLSHVMIGTGFKQVDLRVDKFQRSAFLPMLILYPLIKILSLVPIYHEIRKSKLDDGNRDLFHRTNSIDMLMGRTIIVSARKPK